MQGDGADSGLHGGTPLTADSPPRRWRRNFVACDSSYLSSGRTLPPSLAVPEVPGPRQVSGELEGPEWASQWLPSLQPPAALSLCLSLPACPHSTSCTLLSPFPPPPSPPSSPFLFISPHLPFPTSPRPCKTEGHPLPPHSCHRHLHPKGLRRGSWAARGGGLCLGEPRWDHCLPATSCGLGFLSLLSSAWGTQGFLPRGTTMTLPCPGPSQYCRGRGATPLFPTPKCLCSVFIP